MQVVDLLVDLTGIEPVTSSMPWKRAPSCATGPRATGMQLPYCLRWGQIRQTPRARKMAAENQVRAGAKFLA